MFNSHPRKIWSGLRSLIVNIPHLETFVFSVPPRLCLDTKRTAYQGNPDWWGLTRIPDLLFYHIIPFYQLRRLLYH